MEIQAGDFLRAGRYEIQRLLRSAPDKKSILPATGNWVAGGRRCLFRECGNAEWVDGERVGNPGAGPAG